MKKSLGEKKGITLIALVITIIVLIILAGVSINLLLGDNGLIKRAEDAKIIQEKTDLVTSIQQEIFTEQIGKVPTQGALTWADIESILGEYGTVNKNDDGTIKSLKPTEKDYEIPFEEIVGKIQSSLGDIFIPTTIEEAKQDYVTLKTTVTDSLNNTVMIPNGFKVSSDSGTSINEGIVVEDKKGNQFVWISVPKTETVYAIAGVDIEDFTDDEYTKIYDDLVIYAQDYRNGGYGDVWYDECGIETEEKYEELKKTMLKSVYENGGFYIGKYETGVTEVRTSANDELKEAKIQSELFPYTYVTVEQAQSLASQFAQGDTTSSLMFGIQWDLTCKFIETVKSKELITEDSSSWGNYYQSSFEITKGMYSEDNGQTYQKVESSYNKVTSKEVLLQTGLTAVNSVLNIYDLAGNTWELTLEKSLGGYSETARGGSYGYSNGVQEAKLRSYADYYYSGDTTWSVYNSSFRVSLY